MVRRFETFRAVFDMEGMNARGKLPLGQGGGVKHEETELIRHYGPRVDERRAEGVEELLLSFGLL